MSKLIRKVKVNAKISRHKIYANVFDFNFENIFSRSVSKTLIKEYIRHRKNIGLLHRHVFYWPLETRKMLLQSRN